MWLPSRIEERIGSRPVLAMARDKLLLVATGGTISTQPGPQGLHEERASADELLGTLSWKEPAVEVISADPFCLPSYDLSPEHMRQLSLAIEEAERQGVVGAVVTAGTDSLEEIAYALALMTKPNIPIVLTGAMRPPATPGADGPANLMAALRVAQSRAAAPLGPVIVFQDEIHAARYVTKSHTSKVAAFTSPGFGPIGMVVEDGVWLHVNELSAVDYLGMPTSIPHRVELLWTYAGMDGRLVEAAAAISDGMVVSGMGGGHLPVEAIEPLRIASRGGCPVVLASRTGSGALLQQTYSGSGSETELLAAGLISSGELPPIKARLRLLIGMALGLDPRELFEAHAELGTTEARES